MASKKTSKSAAAPKARTVASAAKKLVKKSAAVAKAAFSKSSAKPAAKKASKPAAKPAKPAAKAAKPAAKAAPKKAAPAPSKPAAKPKPKAAAAPVVKQKTKPAVAAAAPAAAAKPVAKPPAKPAAAAAAPKAAAPMTPEKPTKTAEPAAPPPATGKIAKMMSASKPSSNVSSSSPAAKPPKTTIRKGANNARVLTEEEIRNAPASDYMNDDQLAFFRERLLQMRSEVLAREVDVKERLHQREVFADPADRASAEEEHWLDLRLRERESLLLRKIEDAFRRIRDKEYGYCEKTGEAIGIARLLARPTATVCVDIKGQDERAESQYRDR
jgi:DnaK suppressor protein